MNMLSNEANELKHDLIILLNHHPPTVDNWSNMTRNQRKRYRRNLNRFHRKWVPVWNAYY